MQYSLRKRPVKPFLFRQQSNALVEFTCRVQHRKEMLHERTCHSQADLGKEGIVPLLGWLLLNGSANPDQLVAWTVNSAAQSSSWCVSFGDSKQYCNPRSHKAWLCLWIPYLFFSRLCLQKAHWKFKKLYFSKVLIYFYICFYTWNNFWNNWLLHRTSEIKTRKVIHTKNYQNYFKYFPKPPLPSDTASCY